MSLLGLVRHMAEVEPQWFRQSMAGLDAPPLYRSAAEITTVAPARARPAPIALPIPLVDPLTRAVRPLRSMSM
jgi:hypothetical protein